MKYNVYLVFWAVLAFMQSGAAQARFRGGAVFGLSASQIDGDQLAGYDKLGLTGGLRVSSRLKKRSAASLEILFSQRGAQTELIKDKYTPNYSLTLNYVEVPLQWHYMDWLVEGDNESDSYYKVSFNAGFSWARFMGSRNNDVDSWFGGVAPDYVNKNDISLLLGANFFANKHLGFTFRYVRSLNFIYNPEKWERPPVSRAWLGHCLYFQAFYML
jgi:Outer membrane protein beta-barrel domain